MFEKMIAKLAAMEAEYAERRGEAYKQYMKQEYPAGIQGNISDIFLTRGKYKDSFRNEILDGYVPQKEVLSISPKIYEVVYQARLYPTNTREEFFLLSLFEEQKELQNKHILLDDFYCIGHPFHRFVPLRNFVLGREVLGTDFEIYPTSLNVLV